MYPWNSFCIKYVDHNFTYFILDMKENCMDIIIFFYLTEIFRLHSSLYYYCYNNILLSKTQDGKSSKHTEKQPSTHSHTFFLLFAYYYYYYHFKKYINDPTNYLSFLWVIWKYLLSPFSIHNSHFSFGWENV
jgi:hypothetical protein